MQGHSHSQPGDWSCSAFWSHVSDTTWHAAPLHCSGALLVGPPGTGKTLLAKATAGEVGEGVCK
jgi:DNA replication protein DnaC